MYGLPKVHKQGCPMRPICSAIGTSTYQLSKFIANIIKPASTNKFDTDLKDSFQFLSHLEGFNLNNYFMVSYDVRSLFTNVPLKETIKITMDRLYRSDHIVPPTMPENVLKHLLELCVQDNVFVFNGEVYYQHDGVAMCNSLGTILADIFMCHLEETSILTSDLSPEFYRRYVDDTFCLFSNKEDAIKFLDYINIIHPSIKFDMELENNNKLEFQDIVVERTDSPITKTSTRVKPTDKGLYYHFASFIPMMYKRNKIFTRAYRIASDMLVFDKDIFKLEAKLKRNGFPRDFINITIGKVLYRYHVPDNTADAVEAPKCKEIFISLPFLGPISIIVKRKLLRLIHNFYPGVKLKIVFKRGFTIGNMFHRKDRLPVSCSSMVVYYAKCEKCGPSEAYIGKTINSLYEIFYASGTGHLHPNNKDSPLIKHCLKTGDPECDFNFKNVKIRERGRYDEEIRFIESILLKYDKQNLNTQERNIKLQIA